jgi:glutamate-ammonia-ligase adenylyltransferase
MQIMNLDQFDISRLPGALQETVLDWLTRCADKAQLQKVVDTDSALKISLPRVIACSPYIADVLERYPEMLLEFSKSGRLHRALDNNELALAFGAELSPDLSEAKFQQGLRILRHRELVRIAWRDLTHTADLTETLAELSSLADTAICFTLSWARAALHVRYGAPKTEDGSAANIVILGMGKLGGRELNFSSDVDLIFLYSDSGETDGPRKISNEEYFRFLAQHIVGMLSNTTRDGFVYRVDVRLRPFGDSGPLAVSLPALEGYLVQHGRDWERYAYIKARVINDWSGTESFYKDILRPFIYRRYLDYGVFSSLRDMKSLIEAEVQRKEFQDNIKLGRGGIREIEFIVQSLQLVRGGTNEDLQDRELLPSLGRLVRPGGLPGKAAAELAEAYCFLRQFENRLQAISDRQTHNVPTDELNRSRLALAMDLPDWPALSGELTKYRALVAAKFQNIVFRSLDDPESSQSDIDRIRAWPAGAADGGFSAALTKMGYPDVPAVLEQLKAVRDSGFYLRLDEAGRQRLNSLMPSVIAIAAKQPEPLQTLAGVLRIIESIGRRSAYFSLLNENPEALKRLMELCALSGFLVLQIASHPLLLDELLDQRIFLEAPTRADFQQDLDSRMNATPVDDPEARRDALRNYQQAAMFRVAVADLSGTLPLMKVSDRLTDIAETVLQTALSLAWSELTAQYGSPGCLDEGKTRDVQYAIVAYGKLGGLELGYGSDLDLVFLHDSTGERQHTGGDKQLDNATFFVRLTRRIIHILTMSTTSGALYEVDTRLRPSGNSGLLVSSLTAFDRYQHEDAWTWEHQALSRGRAVAGSDSMRSAFESLRIRILTQYVHWETLRDDVAQMRHRMRGELGKGTAELFDLKQDKGGITDIEFIVQYLVLKEARRQVELLRYSDNIRQLESLAKFWILEEQDADALADAYRTYRRQMHHLALAGQLALVPRSEVKALSMTVVEIWQRVFA